MSAIGCFVPIVIIAALLYRIYQLENPKPKQQTVAEIVAELNYKEWETKSQFKDIQEYRVEDALYRIACGPEQVEQWESILSTDQTLTFLRIVRELPEAHVWALLAGTRTAAAEGTLADGVPCRHLDTLGQQALRD